MHPVEKKVEWSEAETLGGWKDNDSCFFCRESRLGGRRGAGVELMVMHLLTITSDGVASGIVRYAGNGAVGRSHGRIVSVMTLGTLVALVRQVLLGDLQPALSRGFGATDAG